MAHGGDGVISVVSNVVPRLVAELVKACARGDFTAARHLDARLAPVVHAAFVESNPIPVKAMLHLLERAEDVLRLPLTSLPESHHSLLRAVLDAARAPI